MATVLQGLLSTARCCTCRFAAQHYVKKSIGPRRSFSTTPSQWRDRHSEALEKVRSSKAPEVRGVLQAEERLGNIGEEMEGFMEDEWEEMIQEKINPRYPPFQLPPRKRGKKDTFLNMGEAEPWETEDIMEDDDDDISSLGHGELERHREMRHYARLVAWEMPLLSKLAKPFVPPSQDMPLRFRFTSYMGERHPAEKKVVVEFTTADMPNLTSVQREKLKKLAGVRYNPTTDIVKMSCEMYETQAQNKRYLGDVIDSLLIEARDPIDTFEDVPLDTRHHYFKPRPRFPQEWTMTENRRNELEQYRQTLAEKDQQRELTGQLVDGIRQIEDGLKQSIRIGESAPEMVTAHASRGRGSPKRLAVRR